MTQEYQIISAMLTADPRDWKRVYPKLVKQFHLTGGQTVSKSALLQHYRKLLENKQIEANAGLEQFLRLKPVRTLSGVTPVTVLTKPFPCPGECIFCPSDVRMPKSYIASEPGAQRAAQHAFDPYTQTLSRLQTYAEIGHDTGKVELIILGGTWSVYPEPYQRWFITRLFQALNDFKEGIGYRVQGVDDMEDRLDMGETYNEHIKKTHYIKTPESATWEEVERAQKINETSETRCVGLVLETRPDYVTDYEVIRLRRLGATKIQIGIQSVNEAVLANNKRGHTVVQTVDALAKLRQAGFKIHAHWMPNLYGNTVAGDIEEYRQLFDSIDFRPDELKIYPCSLIPDTELVSFYQQGSWKPYSQDELTTVLQFCLTHTPEYCRLTRIVRDIPSQEIMAGNKFTNFRQMVESSLQPADLHDIRSREIKNRQVGDADVVLDDVVYETRVSTEHFLQYITPDRKIAAFLRLSLPANTSGIEELRAEAIIREIHVYGQAIATGLIDETAVQHQGLGKRLIAKAKEIASANGFTQLAVISAVGTREYYRKQGFHDGELYQHCTTMEPYDTN